MGDAAPVGEYDAIARLYDPWSRSVTEDVGFYVDLAREAGGPVVELGVGTGRIAVPTARAGVPVIPLVEQRSQTQPAAGSGCRRAHSPSRTYAASRQ